MAVELGPKNVEILYTIPSIKRSRLKNIVTTHSTKDFLSPATVLIQPNGSKVGGEGVEALYTTPDPKRSPLVDHVVNN